MAKRQQSTSSKAPERAATPTPPVPPGPPSVPPVSQASSVLVQTWESEQPDTPVIPDSRFVGVLGLRTTVIDDEALVVDPLQERHFRLNATGAFIWQRAALEQPLRQIADDLASTYQIDPEEALRIVLDYVHQLVAARLLFHLK